MLHLKVRDLWHVGRRWKWLSFDFLLTTAILMRLANLVVSDDEAREDKLKWGADSNGTLIHREGAYNKLCGTNSTWHWIEGGRKYGT